MTSRSPPRWPLFGRFRCCNCVVISNENQLHNYPATTRLTDWYSLTNQGRESFISLPCAHAAKLQMTLGIANYVSALTRLLAASRKTLPQRVSWGS